MDNFKINITSEDNLSDVIKIACGKYNKGVAYTVDPVKGMIFYWSMPESKDNNIHKLPFSFGYLAIAHFAEEWMKQMDDKTWESYAGKEPDHDGSNGRGFTVYNENYGCIGDNPYAFIAIKPCWAWYGK